MLSSFQRPLTSKIISNGLKSSHVNTSSQFVSSVMGIYSVNPLKQSRSAQYHIGVRRDNELIYAGMIIAGTAQTLRYALHLFNSIPTESADGEDKDNDGSKSVKGKKKKKSQTGSASNPLDSLWATWFARNFYDGGFEEKMTRREAARVLGVRETAPVERVKEAHRRILLLNHPDKGGSPYIAAKINEAKSILMKGNN